MKENKPYAKICSKNKSIHQIVKKEREICAKFAVLHLILKVMVTVHDTCLVKMGKILHLWAEDMNRKCVPNDSNVLHQKTLWLY